VKTGAPGFPASRRDTWLNPSLLSKIPMGNWELAGAALHLQVAEKVYLYPYSVIPTYVILSLSKDEGPIITSSFDRLRMTAE